MKKVKEIVGLLRETFTQWNKSSAAADSAGIAYNAIFSLPGLLIIVIWIAGFFFADEAIRGEINRQVSEVAGEEIGNSIQDMVRSAVWDRENVWMKIIGVFSLVFGATTLFFQMQKSLNELWGVEAAPKRALQKYVLDRANSLGMILIISFLLLISMMLTSVLGIASNWITTEFGLETFILIQVVNFFVSFVVVTILFGLMFKILPDVEIRWNSVWIGAIVTAFLFTIGKFLIGIYFEIAKPTSVFGAAGTIILLMMWINYSCQLVFFGAEFTKVYAIKKGYSIRPSKFAKWNAEKLQQNILEQRESEAHANESKTS